MGGEIVRTFELDASECICYFSEAQIPYPQGRSAPPHPTAGAAPGAGHSPAGLWDTNGEQQRRTRIGPHEKGQIAMAPVSCRRCHRAGRQICTPAPSPRPPYTDIQSWDGRPVRAADCPHCTAVWSCSAATEQCSK